MRLYVDLSFGFSGTLCPKWLSRTKPASWDTSLTKTTLYSHFQMLPLSVFLTLDTDQKPSSSVVWFHLNFLCFQYILCSWFLLHLQKICHVQNKKIILFLSLPGFQTATPALTSKLTETVLFQKGTVFSDDLTFYPAPPKGGSFIPLLMQQQKPETSVKLGSLRCLFYKV